MKPALPRQIAEKFSKDLLHLIYSYVPHIPRKTPSSSYQRALEKLQKSPKRTAMDMYGLDDFVLN